MRKIYNFGAGPAMLPDEILLQAQAEMLDWHGTGMSIMEMGHRGPDFSSVAEQAEADLRELLAIPANYHILFIAGGASVQFAMVPLNLFTKSKTADYIDTGIWSKKAMDEAKRYGAVNVATELEMRDGLIHIPLQEKWSLNPNAAYLHYTPNETIEGIQFHWVPKTHNVPLVADMTSMILSQPIDIQEFGIIYAGAQKNISHAGITLVIIREDLIQDSLPMTPTLYQYKTFSENKSFYNTPPTFAWYMAGLMFSWVKKQGGVQACYELNVRKAQKIYEVIDSHKEFYMNLIHPDSRSIVNVPFNLKTPELTQIFLDEAAKIGLKNLKGHRLAGGVRASIYNAMPEAGVDLLTQFMKEFAKRYG